MAAEPRDYSAIFSFPEGEKVLDDLIKLFGGKPFVPGQPDTTAFNCGAKSVIEHILAQLDAYQSR